MTNYGMFSPNRDKSVPQVVRADESYTLPEFRRRTGLGSYALRKARVDGLPIRMVGKKRFVMGADWLTYLLRMPSEKLKS